MAVTPADIAVALKRTAPKDGSPEQAQWAMWIGDAEMLIETRRMEVDPVRVLDEAKVDYVIREAVVTQVRRPDDSTQVTVSVDVGSTSKTFRSSRGRVTILDEWWTLLGLAPKSSGAFTVTPARLGSGSHAPFCSLHFRGTHCTCGANLTNYAYPLYEGGVLEP